MRLSGSIGCEPYLVLEDDPFLVVDFDPLLVMGCGADRVSVAIPNYRSSSVLGSSN